LINLGNIAAQRNLQESTENYQEALSVATKVQDKTEILTAQNNLAANLIAQADFPAAAKMVADAIRTADSINDQANGVLARINLGSLDRNLGQLADARQQQNAALKIARQLNLRSSIAASLEETGNLSVIEDAFEQAERDYKESLRIRSEIGESAGVASVWLSLASLEMERRNLTQATELAQRAIEEFHKQHNDDLEAAARCVLAKTELLRSGPTVAREQIDLTHKLRVQDRTIALLIETTEARLKAASDPRRATAQLEGIIERATQMKLLGYEFEARLERSNLTMARGGAADLRALAKEADSKGFKLVARKAREAAASK